MNVCMCLTEWMCVWKGMMCIIMWITYVFLCEWMISCNILCVYGWFYVCMHAWIMYMIVGMFVCVCINKWLYEMNEWLNECVSYTWIERL